MSKRWPVRVFREKEWLQREYVDEQRSAVAIADEFGVHENAILWWLNKHGIPRRTMAETRRIKRWGASGTDNPMYGRRGALAPQWKGGVTPERQLFYSSVEWKAAAEAVWERDGGDCQRCGAGPAGHKSIAIHHVAPFRVKPLRAELTNLVLLCAPCHRWVHSPANISGLFRAQKGGAV